jgi:hypothetical protein
MSDSSAIVTPVEPGTAGSRKQMVVSSIHSSGTIRPSSRRRKAPRTFRCIQNLLKIRNRHVLARKGGLRASHRQQNRRIMYTSFRTIAPLLPFSDPAQCQHL